MMKSWERAVAMRQWAGSVKGLIQDHNLWMDDEQIIEAADRKSKELGGDGITYSEAFLDIWRLIPADPPK